jgi:hypothetical protein
MIRISFGGDRVTDINGFRGQVHLIGVNHLDSEEKVQELLHNNKIMTGEPVQACPH